MNLEELTEIIKQEYNDNVEEEQKYQEKVKKKKEIPRKLKRKTSNKINKTYEYVDFLERMKLRIMY